MPMAVLLAVLKILGIILLVILAIVLAIVLLLLFAPFRYSFSGRVEDPEGSEEMLHLDLKRSVSLAGDVRWLAGALHVSAAYDGQGRFRVSILGFSVPVQKLLNRGKKEEEQKEETPSPEQKEKKGISERISREISHRKVPSGYCR